VKNLRVKLGQRRARLLLAAVALSISGGVVAAVYPRVTRFEVVLLGVWWLAVVWLIVAMLASPLRRWPVYMGIALTLYGVVVTTVFSVSLRK